MSACIVWNLSCSIYVHFLRRSSYAMSRVRSLHDDIWEHQVERRLARLWIWCSPNLFGLILPNNKAKRLHPRMHEFQWAHQDWVFSSWLLCHHFSVQQQDQQPYDSSYPFISRHRRTGQNSDNVMEWVDSFFLNKTRDSSQDLVYGPLGSQRISVWNALWWLPDRRKPIAFKPLSIDVSFSWHPHLLASLSLETVFLLTCFLLLHIPFSWHIFSCILCLFFSFQTFSYLGTKVDPVCYWTCTKQFPVVLRTTKLALSSS